ncbi:hypothetical protein PENTCL1PPCAC_29000, partial [Pristionchus entomophagus]
RPNTVDDNLDFLVSRRLDYVGAVVVSHLHGLSIIAHLDASFGVGSGGSQLDDASIFSCDSEYKIFIFNRLYYYLKSAVGSSKSLRTHALGAVSHV